MVTCCYLISFYKLIFFFSWFSIIFLTFIFFLKVRFINFERTKLPEEILKHNLEEKRKYFSDICLEVEKSDAEVQVKLLTLNVISFPDCNCIAMNVG